VRSLGNPTGFHPTAGQAHDLQGFDALLDKFTVAQSVLADKAYGAQERVRKQLIDAKCMPVIPSRANSLNPVSYDKHLYKARHLIENF
jgi:hypothetical protein